MSIFRWVREDRPGARWREALERSWPAYRGWFLRDGDDERPTLAEGRAALAAHMPELVPVWHELVALADGDETVARMLTLYRPTPFLTGCSQAVWLRDSPRLVRNYDYHPALCEGTFLRSAWSDAAVLAASDCLWGALDGTNARGLAVALSYGGRPVVGDGFGITLILRYVLETCATTAEACDVLRRVPSHMAYNVSLVDAAGDHALVRVSPDRPTRVTAEAVATNHQRESETSHYIRATHSKQRRRFLRERLADPETTAAGLVDLFLAPPLYANAHARGHGTLYTVEYVPGEGRARYFWPGAAVTQDLERFAETDLVVPFT